jgi:hypothetical protein
MSLENLLRIGKLRPHAAEKVEVARLLAAAERGLKDAANPGLSGDSRIDLAYRAIAQAALVAMLAHGFRPATSEPGHHQVLIQALPKTIDLPPERLRVLEAYRAARNQSGYRGIPVSDAIAEACIEDGHRLLAEVRTWLQAHRANLV